MPRDPNTLTPLVIISFKTGDKVREYLRYRGDPETFFLNISLAMVAAAVEGADEMVVRVLRPTYE